MKHRIICSILALFAFLTPSAQIIWTEEHTHFDLHFEPIALIAVSQQEIQLSPSMTTTSGLPAFTDSLSASFHLRYTISPVSPGPSWSIAYHYPSVFPPVGAPSPFYLRAAHARLRHPPHTMELISCSPQTFSVIQGPRRKTAYP